MTIVEAARGITGGVDTHLDVHVAAALDPLGGLLGSHEETPLSKAADYDKKNPGKPITIMIEKTNKHPDPAWRIVWGTSAGTSNFSVLIDASTGVYLETTH